jgi:hypothetical protein
MSSSGTRLTNEFRYLLDMINIVFGSGGSTPRPLAPGHGVGVKARPPSKPASGRLGSSGWLTGSRVAGTQEFGERPQTVATGTRAETEVSVRTTGKQIPSQSHALAHCSPCLSGFSALADIERGSH